MAAADGPAPAGSSGGGSTGVVGALLLTPLTAVRLRSLLTSADWRARDGAAGSGVPGGSWLLEDPLLLLPLPPPPPSSLGSDGPESPDALLLPPSLPLAPDFTLSAAADRLFLLSSLSLLMCALLNSSLSLCLSSSSALRGGGGGMASDPPTDAGTMMTGSDSSNSSLSSDSNTAGSAVGAEWTTTAWEAAGASAMAREVNSRARPWKLDDDR